MKQLNIKFTALLSLLLFTIFYSAVAYYLVTLTPHTIYQIVFGLVAFIIYINILRFFILELYTLLPSRISEYFTYLMMYIITISVLVLPFIFDPIVVFESTTLRYVIIGFATVMLSKYFIFMVLGPWHDIVMRLRHRLYFDDIKYEPLVSVMIPAWNEEVGILDTIQSILESSYRKVELVIINDGSTDGSDKKIRTFIDAHKNSSYSDISILYRYQPNTGKGGALNHAIKIAKGDILLSIDADCYVDKNAIAEFVKVFKDPQVSAAVGNVKIANHGNTVGIVQYLEFLFSFYFKRADALLGSIYIIGGAAGAFRRSVFSVIGGYSETNITEDIELTIRMQDAGMKIEYASEATVYTEGASDMRSLKNQRLRWKRGRFQTFYQHIHMFFSTNKKHNKVLTWVIMPLAIVQEVQLLLEIPFLIFLYIYSIINNDFTSYLVSVIVVGLMFMIQLTFYDKSTRHISFIMLAPIGWLIFYLASYIEACALIKTIQLAITKKTIVWQKWDRKGIGHRLKTETF